MMVKVFQKNKNGKIELSIEELENALNDAYWDGYNSNTKTPWWTTPYYTNSVNSRSNLCGNDYSIKTTCNITGDNKA